MEQEAWNDFFEYFDEKTSQPIISTGNQNFDKLPSFISSIDRLVANVNIEAKNAWNDNFRQVMAPPSQSILGALILSAFENDEFEIAKGVYLAWIQAEYFHENHLHHYNIPSQIHHGIVAQTVTYRFSNVKSGVAQSIAAREKQLEALYTKADDQYGKLIERTGDVNELLTTSEKLSDDRIKRMETLSAGTIKYSVKMTEKHKKEFQESQSSRKASFDKVELMQTEAFIKSEDKRSELFYTNLTNQVKSYESLFQRILSLSSRFFRLRKSEFDQRAKNRRAEISSQNDEHIRILDQFRVHMRLKAPVALWNRRVAVHTKNETRALKNFYWAIVVLVIILIGVILGIFDVISQEDGLSSQNIFLASIFFLILTMCLWVIRLQQKVFLSERHLKLDAEERSAFAETFLALNDEKELSPDSMNMVLAALLRPTQDGLIKDDEGGFDPSVVAMISKRMTGSN